MKGRLVLLASVGLFAVLFWNLGQSALTPAPLNGSVSRCGIHHARAKAGLAAITDEKVKREMESQASEGNKRRSSTPIYIPIHYHILYNVNNQGLVDDNTIYYQTFVLNDALNKHGYYFYTDTIERVLNTAWANDCETYSDDIGADLAIQPARSMNVYTCVRAGVTDDGGTILGFTYLPDDYPAASTNNGVFIGYQTLPNEAYSYYSQGDTLVHETGHYIGLYHTFEGGCSSVNDGVSDTPACLANTDTACPSNRDTCPSYSGYDDVKNFMDYSIDSCLNHFTSGQIQRVDSMVATYKPLFSTNAEGSDPDMNFPPFNSDPDNPNASSRFTNWIQAVRFLW